MMPPTQPAATCNVGFSFKENHVGMLAQVRFFIKTIVRLENYVYPPLTLSGSNDNSTWSPLWTADMNIHEGWNYISWETPDQYPKFRNYQFSGSNAGACVFTEIKFKGVETVDDSRSTLPCPIILTLDGQS